MYYKKILLLFLTLILFFSTTTALASSNYQMGGDLNIGANSLFYEDTSRVEIYDSINLELTNNNTAFEINAVHNFRNRDLEMTLRKAYLRKKLMGVNITAGRQPVSWGFGSLINMVDYSLGAEALDQETSAKYIDALKLDYPINWYSSLTFVKEFDPEYEYKYGLRGRTLIKNYDLSLNYIEQESSDNEMSRLGLSLKGDISNTGVYGSFTNIDYRVKGLNGFQIHTEAYMAGADYSYFLDQGYGNRLYLQGEYHLLEKNEGIIVLLNSLAGAGFTVPFSKIPSDDKYFEVFLSNVSYNIDDFSSVGFFTLTSLEDGSTAVIPNYRNQLTNNTTLNINVSYLSGSKDQVFSGGNRLPNAVFNIELSYAF